ncbi:class I tRNA ligase family protein [Candidatus Vidania fulgoroideae]|uniref:Class I tRNA ligase family protein n=1 Tax=Candidatus Vidania fulgoroideorum TaxID=881286 RepID=A0A975AEJ8_9PROT|nr:class I tRNA ligase family protein [Candidatus Vidania fulgoroideae]
MNYYLNIFRNNFANLTIAKSYELFCICMWSTLFNDQLTYSARPLFTIHDGPPYANGQVHLGHMLNKIIKDTVIRKKLLLGYRVWYLPGWDCFGLPIEINIGANMSYCVYYRYAVSQVNLQRTSFITLGCFYNWDLYYCTVDLRVVFRELNAFYLLVNLGYVFVSKTYVDYCSECTSSVSHYETEEVHYVVGIQCFLLRSLAYFACCLLFVFGECIYIYSFATKCIFRGYCSVNFIKFVARYAYRVFKELVFVRGFCWRHKVALRAVFRYQVFLNTCLKVPNSDILSTVMFFPVATYGRFCKSVFSRPYWCISRQRTWGIPITLWYFRNYIVINSFKILKLLAVYGYRSWRRLTLAAKYWFFVKSVDVLDVWFDSGLTHYTVCLDQSRALLTLPVDLCVEGIDQHRGWFNSSYLTSVLLNTVTPFRGLLTHGFAVDQFHKKLSKSAGNFIPVSDVINRYSLELVRFVVVTSDYFKDISFCEEYFVTRAALRKKILNVIGFLTANTIDYPISFFPASLMLVDSNILAILAYLKLQVGYYDNCYHYHISFNLICDFLFNELSAKYLSIVKYRLYVLYKYSYLRLTCQYVLRYLLRELLLLLSPYLCFSIEAIWTSYFSGSVFSNMYMSSPFVLSHSDAGLMRELFILKAHCFSCCASYSNFYRLVIYTFNISIYTYRTHLPWFFNVFSVSVYYGSPAVHLFPFYSLSKCLRCWNYFPFVFNGFCRMCVTLLCNS